MDDNTKKGAPVKRVMDEAEQQLHLSLVNMLHMALAPWRTHMLNQGAQPNADSMLAAAVASYAGTVIGEMVAMGVMPESALRLAMRSLRSNALDGFKAGKAKVQRVAEKVLADGQQGGRQ